MLSLQIQIDRLISQLIQFYETFTNFRLSDLFLQQAKEYNFNTAIEDVATLVHFYRCKLYSISSAMLKL
jgi:hypothetical protein